MANTELLIDRLGAEGDGTAPGPVFVPFALPGERVLAETDGSRRAQLLSVVEASPERVAPPCPLFGPCGGCAVQHLDPAAVLRWKVDRVIAALHRAGFTAPDTIATHQTPPHARRRMDLALRRTADGLAVGLHTRGDDRAVIDLTECAVLRPDLFAVSRAAAPVLARLRGLRARGSLLMNGLSGGIDLLLRTDAPLETADRAALAAFAEAQNVVRIAWTAEPGRGAAPETVVQRGPVTHRLDDVELAPPPGAFLQATADGEEAIRAAVMAGLPPKLIRTSRIVELHAGLGTLSFALAARAQVAAFEGDPAAAAVLARAGATRRIVALRRDLQRQPLGAKELDGAACVVLDPPHGGAAAQMAPLAASDVRRVIYASCDPEALARDAADLAAAGFRLAALTVVDQFRWSARVESVSVFERAAPKGVRRGSSLRSRSGPSRSGW